MNEPAPYEFHPLTPERWPDLEALFGPRGACAGCWCMYWRLRRADFDAQKGDPNRLNFMAIVKSGEVPGLLAYDTGKPVGWISIEPRSAFPALERSRLLKPVDDQPVWSIVCFFTARSHRRRGLTVALLGAAVEYARQQGALLVEGYPVEPKEGYAPDVFVYTGLASAFRKAGFIEVARPSETRPIMRYIVEEV